MVERADDQRSCLRARRFLSLDLNYGQRANSEMYEYLMDNGLTSGRMNTNAAETGINQTAKSLRPMPDWAADSLKISAND